MASALDYCEGSVGVTGTGWSGGGALLFTPVNSFLDLSDHNIFTVMYRETKTKGCKNTPNIEALKGFGYEMSVELAPNFFSFCLTTERKLRRSIRHKKATQP